MSTPCGSAGIAVSASWRSGGVDAALRPKPSVPDLGAYGIQIREETDLERQIKAERRDWRSIAGRRPTHKQKGAPAGAPCLSVSCGFPLEEDSQAAEHLMR